MLPGGETNSLQQVRVAVVVQPVSLSDTGGASDGAAANGRSDRSRGKSELVSSKDGLQLAPAASRSVHTQSGGSVSFGLASCFIRSLAGRRTTDGFTEYGQSSAGAGAPGGGVFFWKKRGEI